MSLHPQQAREVLALLWPHDIDAGASRLRPPPCPCCGSELALEVHEVWDQRDFLLDACCEDAHDRAVDLLNEDPRQAAELLRLLDIDALCGHRLRRVAEDDGADRLVLDWRLEIRPVRYSTARDFVRQHHAHCASPPPGWKFGAGAFNGPDLIGVAMVSIPAARLIDASRTLEVRRLCVRRDLPRPLTHNACSLLYGWCGREARRRGIESLVTYTLLDEPGSTLRASGWTPERVTAGGTWNRASRPRVDKAPTTPKVRWRRVLRASGLLPIATCSA